MGVPRRRARLKPAVALILALLWSLLPTMPAQAAPIGPGFDLFHTDPGTTNLDFGPNPIPTDFFGPNSDPFNGNVRFAGKPLETFMGNNVGDTDTIVQRDASNPNPLDTVPIEIVALSLVSMQPITVTYNGGQNQELWNVNAGLGPNMQQPGQITINMPTGVGGTFDSQLPVVPRLTFTRLSDGSTRTLDPGVHVLVAAGVPWRTGCQLPALHVPGLNDGFCPSYDGNKLLTVEQSPIVDHGVYPAQHSLEHFKCYRLRQAPFNPVDINLEDQFQDSGTDPTSREELCNPVRKRQEPFQNGRAHHVCYAKTGSDSNQQVVVRNQFGSQRLDVNEPRRVCVPSKKREVGHPFRDILVPIDHQQCYNIEPLSPLHRRGPIGRVRLRDQFGEERVRIGQPVQLCAPAEKFHDPNTFEIQHPTAHLVCYEIQDAFDPVTVYVQNQFENKKLRVRRPVMLCVPSAKVVLP
ncbi:MAG: hypothetical protein WD276_00105 [Actinomycetota bacterium]